MTYDKNNPETIQTMFGSIAKQYDRTNAILSFQMHRYWNSYLVRTLCRQKPQVLLDLCCGTGEIGLNFLKRTQGTKAYLLDFCPEMIECARQKAGQFESRVHFIQGDAMNVPLASNVVDAITIAYGIRNVKDPALCFAEAFRVLRPGGTFAILELTRPKILPLRWSHSFYLKYCLPLIGKLATSNRQAYQYLCQSIQTFIEPEHIKEQLYQAGFKNVKCTPLMGGIATQITATD